MTYVRPRPWWLIVLIYAAVGLLLALSVPVLKAFAISKYGRVAIAIFFLVNIALPVCVAALSLLYPSFRTALGGTLAMTVAFLAATGQIPVPTSTDWLFMIVRRMGPIMFAACICYHLVALASVGAMRAVRRVGYPPDPNRCAKCNYPLAGLNHDRCPECFTPFAGKKAFPIDEGLHHT